MHIFVAIPDRYDDLADEDVGDLASDSFLINGRGRFNNTAPLTIHRVDQGQQYMFRFINTGFDNMVEVMFVMLLRAYFTLYHVYNGISRDRTIS